MEHIQVFSYTGPQCKVYDNVELENMTIQDLKVCVSDVIGEYDLIYYITEDGIKLVNNDSIGELVCRSKLSENVATLYVYHVTPPNVDSDNEIGIDDEIFHSYSDAKFEEIRRTSTIERKKMDELENEISSSEESDDSFHESDLDRYTSEESDDEVCYATPPDSYKGKMVVKTFNENIQAKDIQWKVGLTFVDKKQFKNAIRSSSMETGRPYNYIVDDLKRVQVGCAKGCPFKMWVTYIERKAQVVEPDETHIEVELQSKEVATGETSLMDEMLQHMEEEAHSQESQQVLIRLGDDIQTEAHVQTKAGMKFMPTPGTRKSRGHVTGCTPPASTPPTTTSQNQRKGKQISKSSQLSNSQTRTSSGSVSRKGKKFTAPRQIKK
ncbi:hypothetical protein POM88_026859 [Heracleum sosnowskyi]|uniref:Transposase MuDR plant domain-containing protein n=1 Tax=Heracleum sosnowskyi TaxID=360622 RepID=A0AAD8ML02_9APIA|nr:hypothetical protein POM88_026859 [Heracleum sosnowskyi]